MFKEMDTELPILSTRKIVVERNNEVKFKSGGGTIRNRDTGRTLHFHEHDGVYFLKLKVRDPKDLGLVPSEGVHGPGFGRLGR